MEAQVVKKGVLNAFNGILPDLSIQEIEKLQDLLSIQLHKMTEKEILNKILQVAEVTPTKAAEITKIPQPRFSEWLNGKRVPKWSTLNEIAENLGIKINPVLLVES